MNHVNDSSKGMRAKEVKRSSINPWMVFIILLLFVYFLLFIGQPLIKGDWCLLNDYMGYYSAGQIMNKVEPSLVYDFNLLKDYQADILRSCGSYEPGAEVISMVYLPVFMAPFQLFALLDFSISTMLWIILNFTLLSLYLVFFAKKVFEKKLSLQVVILIFVSIPVFRNFIHGQVNLLLLISMGEFVRAIVSEKQFRAGLWLGLILIKPQMLILLLPFLLIQRKYKALVGFVVSSCIIVSASFLFGGIDGMVNFKNIIFESAKGGATSNYELMMNWRAVSYYVTQLAGDGTGNAVLIGGSVLTAAIPLVVFRKRLAVDSPMFMVALLGVMAATTLVTYHAHTHSAMILIPLLLYLLLNGQLRERMFNLWFLAPSVFNLTQFLVGALVILSILPFGFGYYVNFSNGLILFVINFILLGWAVCQARPGDEKPHLSEG